MPSVRQQLSASHQTGTPWAFARYHVQPSRIHSANTHSTGAWAWAASRKSVVLWSLGLRVRKKHIICRLLRNSHSIYCGNWSDRHYHLQWNYLYNVDSSSICRVKSSCLDGKSTFVDTGRQYNRIWYSMSWSSFIKSSETTRPHLCGRVIDATAASRCAPAAFFVVLCMRLIT